MTDIRPIKDPEAFFYGAGWFVLGFVMLALLLLGCWFWLRRRSTAPAPEQVLSTQSPVELALRQLDEAWLMIQDPVVFTVRISTILRQFLEKHLSLPAPERTTEEFLLEIQSCPRLKTEQRAKLAEFLQCCDLVKFAREELLVPELRSLHQAAQQLIQETSEPVVPAPAQSLEARSA